MLGASPSQGAPVLNCPGCGTQVADGTSICPSCDYIIDSSFISADAPQDSDDVTGSGPAPTRKPAPASRPVRTAPGARSTGARPAVRTNAGAGSRPRQPAAAAPEVATEDATNIKSMDEIVRNAPPRATGARSSPGTRAAPPRPGGSGARAAAAPAPRRPQQTELDPAEISYTPSRDSSGTGSSQIVAPEEVMDDFRQFVGLLGFSDKIAFGGAGAIVVSAFLPWKETAADGDILGLMSLGLVGVVGALAVMGAIAVRVRRSMPSLNVLIPWLAQLGLSVFCVLWCIIFMKLSYDATEVPSPMGNATVMNSTPSMGVYLALLGALGSLAGTLLGLKEKPAS